jgi:hypothetical protein
MGHLKTIAAFLLLWASLLAIAAPAVLLTGTAPPLHLPGYRPRPSASPSPFRSTPGARQAVPGGHAGPSARPGATSRTQRPGSASAGPSGRPGRTGATLPPAAPGPRTSSTRPRPAPTTPSPRPQPSPSPSPRPSPPGKPGPLISVQIGLSSVCVRILLGICVYP